MFSQYPLPHIVTKQFFFLVIRIFKAAQELANMQQSITNYSPCCTLHLNTCLLIGSLYLFTFTQSPHPTTPPHLPPPSRSGPHKADLSSCERCHTIREITQSWPLFDLSQQNAPKVHPCYKCQGLLSLTDSFPWCMYFVFALSTDGHSGMDTRVSKSWLLQTGLQTPGRRGYLFHRVTPCLRSGTAGSHGSSCVSVSGTSTLF